ncbi:MAG: HIRAN domain-containing protein [Eggerthellaceae bacterium]|nr:HIRAN domain-containing protein [Eggerthellaceae bacterium]
MYEPSRLVKTFHISGFQYHDGAFVLDKLKPGKKLKMVPNPENPYDPYAIELRYKKAKLGYVPRSENEILALAAFYGHKGVFEARVLKVDPEAEPWRQVRVGIYVTDKRG